MPQTLHQQDIDKMIRTTSGKVLALRDTHIDNVEFSSLGGIRRYDFINVTFSRCRFSHITEREELIFEGCHLSDVSFYGCDIPYMAMTKSHCENISIINSLCHHGHWYQSRIDGMYCVSSSFEDNRFLVDMSHASFSNCILDDSTLCMFVESTLSPSSLDDVSFGACSFRGANFSQTQLSHVRFYDKTIVDDSTFADTVIRQSGLRESTVSRCDFSSATIHDVTICDSELINNDIRTADVTYSPSSDTVADNTTHNTHKEDNTVNVTDTMKNLVSFLSDTALNTASTIKDAYTQKDNAYLTIFDSDYHGNTVVMTQECDTSNMFDAHVHDDDGNKSIHIMYRHKKGGLTAKDWKAFVFHNVTTVLVLALNMFIIHFSSDEFLAWTFRICSIFLFLFGIIMNIDILREKKHEYDTSGVSMNNAIVHRYPDNVADVNSLLNVTASRHKDKVAGVLRRLSLIHTATMMLTSKDVSSAGSSDELMMMCATTIPLVNKMVNSLRNDEDMSIYDDVVDSLNDTCDALEEKLNARYNYLVNTIDNDGNITVSIGNEKLDSDAVEQQKKAQKELAQKASEDIQDASVSMIAQMEFFTGNKLKNS